MLKQLQLKASRGFFLAYLFFFNFSELQGFRTTPSLLRRQAWKKHRTMVQGSGTDDSDSSQFSVASNGKLQGENDVPRVESEPRFKIGVLADIQYAPIPDGHSFAGVLRYYRHSLEVARHAANHFEKDGAEVVLNLGDIIDGKCQAIEENGGEPLAEGADPGISAIDDVLEALEPYKRGPILHTYGNHELYNLDRKIIGEKLKIPFEKEPCGDLVGYWTVRCLCCLRSSIFFPSSHRVSRTLLREKVLPPRDALCYHGLL